MDELSSPVARYAPSMHNLDSAAMDAAVHNADFPWDSFDSESYFDHNYRSVRHDDRQILEFVRDYFADAKIPAGSRGIDVGTGPNLYPALAMLPFCEAVELYEFSAHNIDWLRHQRATGWPSWDEGLRDFWKLYSARSEYGACGEDPRDLLRRRTKVVQGSVFDLKCEAGERFAVGTMFFVAESLSSDRFEFELAVERFLGAFDRGAPFAAAFMEESKGYEVDGMRFPATAVNASDVRYVLERWATDVELKRIGIDGAPLREGYSGMIIAVGRAKEPSEAR